MGQLKRKEFVIGSRYWNLLQGVLLLLVLMITGCTQRPTAYQTAMQEKLCLYTPVAESQLAPYFNKVGISYPPKQLAFLIFKNTRQMQVFASDNGAWKYIKTFPILAASGTYGPKLKEGDHQVPEGVYRIIALNPQSHYHLSMQLNYPNRFDKICAQRDGRNHLGGSIFIHGHECSAGCLAIGNSAVQQLFPLSYYVGTKNITVIITPTDLRREKPFFAARHPKWLPLLYQQISVALEEFPSIPE